LERVRFPGAGIYALYHDCSYTSTYEDLIQALVSDKLWFPTSLVNMPKSFIQVIQALPHDKPLVLLFDEVDKLLRQDSSNDYPLFKTLRALANVGHCHFVFSGEQSL